jgi:hypothetical protein
MKKKKERRKSPRENDLQFVVQRPLEQQRQQQ